MTTITKQRLVERSRVFSPLRQKIVFVVVSLAVYFVVQRVSNSDYQYIEVAETKRSSPPTDPPRIGNDGAGTRPDDSSSQPRLANLDCSKYGGPRDPHEMVYWKDIPKDAAYRSPLRRDEGIPKYFTFEPDEGGWNNVRMVRKEVSSMSLSHILNLVAPETGRQWCVSRREFVAGKYSSKIVQSSPGNGNSVGNFNGKDLGSASQVLLLFALA